MTVSMLKGADGYQAKEVEKMLRWLRREPRFDAINLPFTLLIGLAKPLKEALGVPIACTLQGEDLFLDNLTEPYKSQSMDLIRRALPDVDRFISVSRYYTGFMADYLGIPPEKIDTVPLGITLDGHEARPLRTEPPYTIGYFGRIAPEKGVHLLAEAYRELRRRPGVPKTRLVAGGYLLEEHREYFNGVKARLGEWGLAGEFHYAGAPDRAGKIALLQSFDVMSMPSIYHEPKGFTLLESMANGVPVVQPAHGAFVEIVETTGGGVLVAPEDPGALADAWFDLLTDRAKAQALGTAGAAAVREHYSLDRMAAAAERVYEQIRC
jgi:glycosyltransferase involved in cell wall biosynthesis